MSEQYAGSVAAGQSSSSGAPAVVPRSGASDLNDSHPDDDGASSAPLPVEESGPWALTKWVKSAFLGDGSSALAGPGGREQGRAATPENRSSGGSASSTTRGAASRGAASSARITVDPHLSVLSPTNEYARARLGEEVMGPSPTAGATAEQQVRQRLAAVLGSYDASPSVASVTNPIPRPTTVTTRSGGAANNTNNTTPTITTQDRSGGAVNNTSPTNQRAGAPGLDQARIPRPAPAVPAENNMDTISNMLRDVQRGREAIFVFYRRARICCTKLEQLCSISTNKNSLKSITFLHKEKI